jgi:hypothetical protein
MAVDRIVPLQLIALSAVDLYTQYSRVPIILPKWDRWLLKMSGTVKMLGGFKFQIKWKCSVSFPLAMFLKQIILKGK